MTEQDNTTQLGSGANRSAQTYFTYDSSDRNTGITESNTAGSITTAYGRDVQGRLLYRHQDTNRTSVSNDYYGYTASSDSPDFITDVSGNVTEKYLSLTGGVKVTIRPDRASTGALTYSLPNIHGDVFATVDADGKILGTHQTGPFGEKLSNQTTPWNTLNGGTMGYVGAALKLTEAQLALQPIQMGARLYIPALGRFLSVDPVQGGTPNNYVYPPEPVNGYDLTGTFAPLVVALAPFVGRVAVGAAVKMATSYGGKKVAQQAVTKSVAKSAYQKYQIGMQGAKVTQNTTRIDSALLPGKYRVPDALTRSSITEVKNVKYQSYTSQLKDYSAIAKRDNLQFTLKINNDARLSGPLKQAENDEFLRIIGY